MNKVVKSFLILALLTPNIATATPISITSDKPLKTTINVGETAYGYYLIKAKPGLPIVFYNQFPSMIQQIPGDTEEYCTTQMIIPSTGQCKIKLKVMTTSRIGTINGKIKTCVEGLRTACTQHEITIQVVEAIFEANTSDITIINSNTTNTIDNPNQTPVTPHQNTTVPDATPVETITPPQNTTTDIPTSPEKPEIIPEPSTSEISMSQPALLFQPKKIIYNSPFYGVCTDNENIYTVTGNNLLLIHGKNLNSQIWESVSTDDNSAHLIDVCTTASGNTYVLAYDGNIYKLTKNNSSYKLSKVTANNENMYGSNELHCSGNKIYTTSLFGLFGGQYALSIYDEKGSQGFTYQNYSDLKLDKMNKAYEAYATYSSSKFTVATDNGVSICQQPSNCTAYRSSMLPSTVYTVFEDQDQLTSYAGTDQGLFIGNINKNTNLWNNLSQNITMPYNLRTGTVYDLYSSDNNFCAATEKGLFIKTNNNWFTFDANTGLTSNVIFKAFSDNEGFYAATAAGLSWFLNNSNTWNTFTYKQKYNQIQNIAVNKNGKLAIYVPDVGLTVTDATNSQSFQVSTHHLASDQIKKIYVSTMGITFVIAKKDSTSLLGILNQNETQWRFFSNKSYRMFNNMDFINIIQADSKTIYLVTYEYKNNNNYYYIFKSEDLGETWVRFNRADIIFEKVDQVDILTLGDTVILMAPNNNMYRVDNFGMPARLIVQGNVNLLTAIPKTNSKLYMFDIKGTVYLNEDITGLNAVGKKIAVSDIGEIKYFSYVQYGNVPYITVVTKDNLFIGHPDDSDEVWVWHKVFVNNDVIINNINSISSYIERDQMHIYIIVNGILYEALLSVKFV